MKYLVRILLLLTVIATSSQAFGAGRGCAQLDTFLDLALKRGKPVAQAEEIEKRLHSLIEAQGDARVLDNGNYVEAKVLRYEDGKVVFSKNDGTEITHQIDDDFDNFFKLKGEIEEPVTAVAKSDEAASNVDAGQGQPQLTLDQLRELERREAAQAELIASQAAKSNEEVTSNLPAVISPDVTTDIVAGLDDAPIAPSNNGITLTRSQPPARVDNGTSNLPAVTGGRDVQPYVYNGEIVEPGTDIVTRTQPSGSLDDQSKIIDLSPDDYTVIDETRAIGQTKALDAPEENLLLPAPGSTKNLPAIPPVRAADIPDEGRFIRFEKANGEEVVARVIGTTDNGDVRVVVKGSRSDRLGVEETIPLENIKPGSLSEINEADAPYQVIRRANSDEIPTKGTVFTYTSPKQQNSYTARVVGEPTDASVKVERLNDAGELVTENIRLRDMRGDSIKPLTGNDIPTAFHSQSRDLVPAADRAVAVVDDAENTAPTSTSLTLRENGTEVVTRNGTEVAGTGTDLQPKVYNGEIVDNTDVVRRNEPAGSLDDQSRIIDLDKSQYSVVDETAELTDDARRATAAISYEDSAAALKTPPKPLSLEEFQNFYGDSFIRFDSGDSFAVGQIKGAQDGRLIIDNGSKQVYIDPSKINRGNLDVLDLNLFKKSDSDLVFVKENFEPFKGPFGALNEAGKGISDDEVFEILKGGARFRRVIDGMVELVSKTGKRIRISAKKLIDGGVTMANKAGDLRTNFKRVANLSRPGKGVGELEDLWSVVWGDENAGDTSGDQETGDTSGNQETGDTSGNQETGDTSGNQETETDSGTGDDDGGDDDDDDDDDDEDQYGIPPAPSGNPVRPQFQQQQKLKIIRTRGVY